jgi:Family of unknown function (DUF6483)
MIRRDYILRMIQEFFTVLSRIRALKNDERWNEASALADEQFQRLLGSGAEAILGLSDTELLARVIQTEPAQATRERTLMLISLLKEAGDAAAGAGKESVPYHLKALHLLLETLTREEPSDWPEFVPRVEEMVGALGATSLPLETQARLMQHFERSGQFAKAEDRLFEMLQAEPEHPGLVEFGLAFYERMERQSDDRLLTGNLPRTELEAGRTELKRRQTTAA